MVYAVWVHSLGTTHAAVVQMLTHGFWPDTHNLSSLGPDAEDFARAGEDSWCAESKVKREY
jgi:hypothetical protein